MYRQVFRGGTDVYYFAKDKLDGRSRFLNNVHLFAVIATFSFTKMKISLINAIAYAKIT